MNTIKKGKYYKADLLVSMSGKIYRNKIFKIFNGRLEFVNKTKDEVIELEKSLVYPSPVNAHTHLELTELNKEELNFSSFAEWVVSIIKLKRECSEKFLLKSYENGKRLLSKYNTLVYGNILSPFLYNLIPEKERNLNFVEIIEYREENIGSVNINYPKISPHSFYSVHPKLILKILNMDIPKSMHFFESKDEYEYLINNRGGIIEKIYKFVGLKPIKYSFDFFESFLKKASNIQLIHLSNLPEKLKPIILYRKDKIFYTLCPRSNSKFGSKSPYYFFVKNSIPFSLGTDSLCSNDDLNVINEAKYIYNDLKDYFPKEELSKILFFSLTKWGYRAIFKKFPEYTYITNIESKNIETFSDIMKLLFENIDT